LAKRIEKATGVKLGKPPTTKQINRILDVGPQGIFKVGGKAAKAGAKAAKKVFTPTGGSVLKKGVKRAKLPHLRTDRELMGLSKIETQGLRQQKTLHEAEARAKLEKQLIHAPAKTRSQIVTNLLNAAKAGEVWAIQAYLDRVLGKPAQAIEHKGEAATLPIVAFIPSDAMAGDTVDGEARELGPAEPPEDPA